MKAFYLCAALAAAFVPAAAMAKTHCDVPTDLWQPRDALKTKLEHDGWTVRQIKTQNGCYEAYAVKADGKRMETFFDPKTLVAVGDDAD